MTKSDTLLVFEFPTLLDYNVMVSVGVLHMGKTGVIFIESGAKVNSLYYCERALGERLLPHVVSTDGLSSRMMHHRTLPKTRLGCTAAGWTH